MNRPTDTFPGTRGLSRISNLGFGISPVPCLFLVLTLALVLASCQTPSEHYGLHELGVARQQVREIAPLALEQAEPNEAAPEPNRPPERLELSLPQSRALALENNLRIKTVLLGPSIVAARLSAEEAKFEAAFFGGLSADQFSQPTIGTLGEITGSHSESLGGDFGVQVPLTTGGAVTFDASDQWNQSNALGLGSEPYWTSQASISISQPLLRNAGRPIAMYSIRVAAYVRDANEVRTKLEVMNVLAGLDRIYWRLYAARKELDVRRQQYELAQAQLHRA